MIAPMPPLQIRSLKKNSKPREEPSQQQETQSNESSPQSVVASEKPQETQPAASKAETTTRFFQAIGVIEGEVSFDEKRGAKITLANQDYRLKITDRKYKRTALQKRIRETGNSRQRLVVWPQAIHLPDPNQPHQIQFQFLRVEKDTKRGILQELDDMEFQIAGIWQFIPVCQIPCLSIYKNFTPERIEWIKKADAKQRVNFQKPVHLPVLWNEALVKPFKYDPNAQEQEKPAFVQIKAKFNPSQNAFEFVSLLEEPTTENVPRFLKPSKKDKQLAQQKKKKKNPLHQKTSQHNQKEQTTEERDLSVEERITQIANQLENLSEIAQQNQGKQAEFITKQLIAHHLKDDNYTLPKNYISNWKHGKNLPKETSKHYPAYQLWQLIISSSS